MKRAATFSENFRELGLLVFIVILCVAFQIRNHNFLALDHIVHLSERGTDSGDIAGARDFVNRLPMLVSP